MKNIIKIICVYVGTIIGAGFASGQEMMTFFTVYRDKAIYTIIFSIFLFILVSSYVLDYVHRYKIEAYDKWLFKVFGRKMYHIINLFILIFIFSLYCVMLAGAGTLLNNFFGWNVLIGASLMSFCLFITFIYSLEGLSIVNILIVPAIFIGILIIGVKSIGIQSVMNIDRNFNITGNYIISAFLYVSYNIIGLVAILFSLNKFLVKRRDGFLAGVGGSLVLGVMMIIIYKTTNENYELVRSVQIPMLEIGKSLGIQYYALYGVVLLGAMFTTAASNGYIVIEYIRRKTSLNNTLISLIFCIATIPLCNFGFKSLIQILYPIFGYLAFFTLISILLKKIRSLL